MQIDPKGIENTLVIVLLKTKKHTHKNLKLIFYLIFINI
jgi:hypothetical protein